MNLEFKDYLEKFSKLPEHLKQASQYAMNHKDRNYDNIVSYRRFSQELSKYVYNFERQFKDKISQETFNRIRDNIYNAIWLTRDMVDVMQEAYFTKNENKLDILINIVNGVDRIKQLSEMNIDEIVKEFEQAQNTNQNVNSQTMQPYTQSHDYSYQSSRSNSTNNTQSTTSTAEPSLDQKLADVRDNYGNKDDNFGHSVMQTALDHELTSIQSRIEVLKKTPNLTFSQTQELNKLEKDKEAYEEYISAYSNSLRSSLRENKLGKTEARIRNIQTKMDNQKAPARSFLGRRIQKYKLDRLKIRLDKLKEKRGILMDKQQKAVLSRVGRNTNFIKFTNNINAFGETLGTEVSNIYNDLREYFSSCKKNNKLLNRLEQLKSKLIVCERTYPCSSYIQARTL